MSAASENSPAAPIAPIEWLCLLLGGSFSLLYGWILDDAFIYFRYVDNLVQLGHGLVYNRGEYVEGFTSPAWAILLTGLRLTQLDWWVLIRLLAVANFALFWWLLVRLHRVMAPAGVPTLNLPLIVLSCNYAVACYFTSGVETPLVQVTAIGFALFAACPHRRLPAILVGLSPLVRPELALPFALVVLLVGWRNRRAVRLPVLVAATTLGSWLVFRVVYYADLLPNTFYLKDLADVGQGWIYLHQTFHTYGTYYVLGGLAGLALVLHRRGTPLQLAARGTMVVVALAVTAYIVRIGGDPRHYRYLAFPFCLLFAATAGLAEHGLAVFAPRVKPVAVTGLGVLLAGLVAACYPPQLASHPIGGNVEHTRIDKINDAIVHRYHADLQADPWTLEPRFDLGAAIETYRNRPDKRRAYAGVYSDAWCYTGFRMFDTRILNSAGLTDAYLARVEMKPDRPGHKKGLGPLAQQLVELQVRFGRGRGSFRKMVEAGAAPPWIENNLDVLEVIERKVHNQHDLIENLSLAFTFPGRVIP